MAFPVKEFAIAIGFGIMTAGLCQATPSFTISTPLAGKTLPVLIDSPHSGRWYPRDFRYNKSVTFTDLRKAEDAFVDLLLAKAPHFGFTVLTANFPRAYVDVNRRIDDIDLAMIADRAWQTPVKPTDKSSMGIGLFRRHVIPGVAIYDRTLSESELRRRLTRYYQPYHSKLTAIADDMAKEFGRFYHIDVHSMKSLSNAMTPEGEGFKRPDIVVGDLDGVSCDRRFTTFVTHELRSFGYNVTINQPYRGAEVIRRTGDPKKQRHALQIEINRALYLNEDTVTLDNEKFGILKNNMSRFFASLQGWVAGKPLDDKSEKVL